MTVPEAVRSAGYIQFWEGKREVACGRFKEVYCHLPNPNSTFSIELPDGTIWDVDNQGRVIESQSDPTILASRRIMLQYTTRTDCILWLELTEAVKRISAP